MKYLLLLAILSMAIILASTGRVKATTNKSDPKSGKVPHNKKLFSNKPHPDDGCGDHSVRFTDDGLCYPVLKQGPCSSVHYWVTVDPETLEGRCSHRVCGRNRVLVDHLCHHIHHPEKCHGGRRLFYSAYGDTVCDCPLGHYPFPGEDDECVLLFTQGPCPYNQVVTPSPSGKLECKPSVCQSGNGEDLSTLQVFPHSLDGQNQTGSCLPIGHQCSHSEVLGYNIFQRRGECVDMLDSRTQYHFDPELNDMLDEAYDLPQLAEPEPQIVEPKPQQPVKLNATGWTRGTRLRRHVHKTQLFQASTYIPEPILHACQPGDRTGNNFKCTHPVVTTRHKRELSPDAHQRTAPPICDPPKRYSRQTNTCS